MPGYEFELSHHYSCLVGLALEEKTNLQTRLDEFLLPRGVSSAAADPITQEVSVAQIIIPSLEQIDLNGLVTDVNLKNSMAAISIGKADGVKAGMKFHVTRGDAFVCDIIILEVDAEEAVGFLELMEQQPQVGDSASTNF